MAWVIWFAFWVFVGVLIGQIIKAIRTPLTDKSRNRIPLVLAVWAVVMLVVVVQLLL